MTLANRKKAMRESLAARAKFIACNLTPQIDNNLVTLRATFIVAGRKCAVLTNMNLEIDGETRAHLLDDFIKSEARFAIYKMLKQHDLNLVGPRGKLPA
jgi:hypothetical protein